MVSKRIDEASKIIEESLKDIYDSNISITQILTKCLAISKLLDIEKECEWIRHELNGYFPNIDKDGNTIPHNTIPEYRFFMGLADVIEPPGGYRDSLGFPNTGWQMFKPETPRENLFWVSEPCSFLENVKEMTLKQTLIKKFSNDQYRYVLYTKFTKPRILGVLSAVRVKALEFLIAQKIKVRFTPLVEHIMEGTKDLVINTLREIDTNLLDLLVIALDTQRGGDELDWQSTADSCRSIIERFTELLMTDQIITKPDEKPDEADPVKKLSLILNFVRKQLTKKKSDKYEKLAEAGLDYLFNYFQSLKAIIQKVRHKPTASENKILKDEADRAVAYVLLWMADIIHLLNRAGFDWSKSKELVSGGGATGKEK